jgi:subtilisin
MSERRSVIITFKTKDKRPERHIDKLEIVRRVLAKGTRAHFLDAKALASDGNRAPSEDEVIGYDVNLYEAPIVSAQLTQSEVQALREDGNVAMIEDDAPCHATGFGPYPHLDIEDVDCPVAEYIPPNISQVKADQAWGVSTGAGIKVAVLDTGIDGNHPDLTANYKGGVSCVTGNMSAMDDQGHGTHCAGIIAAARNGTGLVGVAPDASLYAVKILDSQGNGQFSWAIAGIQWCIDNGINIASMSLGCEAAPFALQLICDRAWSQYGVLIVAGAGNQSDGEPVPPQESNVEYPARYTNVVGVSSIDSASVIALNSARGPEVKLCAPGVEIQSTVLGGKCGKRSGTSVACPHVAGVAALAWHAHLASNITNEQVWNLLAHTADNPIRPGRDSCYGYGLVNAWKAVQATSFPAPHMPKKACCH